MEQQWNPMGGFQPQQQPQQHNTANQTGWPNHPDQDNAMARVQVSIEKRQTAASVTHIDSFPLLFPL